MYLSGMSPSWPWQQPSHQSCEACVYSTSVSPFLKDSSRPDRPSKSCRATASFTSGSVYTPHNSIMLSLALQLWKFDHSWRWKVNVSRVAWKMVTYAKILPMKQPQKSRRRNAETEGKGKTLNVFAHNVWFQRLEKNFGNMTQVNEPQGKRSWKTDIQVEQKWPERETPTQSALTISVRQKGLASTDYGVHLW